MAAVFIAMEGLDGSGGTTQTRLWPIGSRQGYLGGAYHRRAKLGTRGSVHPYGPQP